MIGQASTAATDRVSCERKTTFPPDRSVTPMVIDDPTEDRQRPRDAFPQALFPARHPAEEVPVGVPCEMCPMQGAGESRGRRHPSGVPWRRRVCGTRRKARDGRPAGPPNRRWCRGLWNT